MQKDGCAEPFSALLKPWFRIVFIFRLYRLPDRERIKPARRTTKKHIEKADKYRQPTNKPIQPKIHLPQRLQHPPRRKQPAYERR